MSRYSAEVGRALATAMHAQRDAVFAQQEVERLRAEVARVTAERDEARRELCRVIGYQRQDRFDATAIAAERGWDCFKGWDCYEKEGGGA